MVVIVNRESRRVAGELTGILEEIEDLRASIRSNVSMNLQGPSWCIVKAREAADRLSDLCLLYTSPSPRDS